MAHSSLSIDLCRGFDALPAAFVDALPDASAALFRSRAWLENAARHGVPAGDRLRFFAATGADGAPRALLPAIYSRLYSAHPRARLYHFWGTEGMPYEPALAPAGDDAGAEALAAVVDFLCTSPRPFDVLRWSPLVAATPLFDGLVAALRRASLPIQIYRTAPEAYADTEGLGYAGFRANRPAGLRDVLDRVRRGYFDRGRAAFRLVAADEEVADALPDFEAIRLVRPERPEAALPGYAEGIMRAAARAGALRLGLLQVDGKPAAAQLWVVTGGIAHCLRRLVIPGRPEIPLDDVVAEHVVRHLLDVDRVRRLDFGATLAAWADERGLRTRERAGVIAFNPRSWRGIKGIARHIAAPRWLALPVRVLKRMRGR